VLDVFYALLKVSDFLDLNCKQSVQRDLAVNVGLSLHKAARVSARTTQTLFHHLLFFLEGPSLLPCQVLRLALVSNVKGQLTNDTVGSLAITCTIQEDDAAENGLLFFAVIAPCLLIMVINQVS